MLYNKEKKTPFYFSYKVYEEMFHTPQERVDIVLLLSTWIIQRQCRSFKLRRKYNDETVKKSQLLVAQGAVSLTYLSVLKEGFTPIFSATLSYGKAFQKKTGVTFPIGLGQRSVYNFSHSVNMAATLNITLWKC